MEKQSTLMPWTQRRDNSIGHAPPYFDSSTGSWKITRFQDISAVLRDNRSQPTGASPSELTNPLDELAHMEFRRAGLLSLNATVIKGWEGELKSLADRRLSAIPNNAIIDIVEHFAKPWSLDVASHITQADPNDAGTMAEFAHALMMAAAFPYDIDSGRLAGEASANLDVFFQSAQAINMQMFIALCESLPMFLGNVWTVLLRHPEQMKLLRAHPELMERAMDEGLRYAGPAHMQFRRAMADILIQDVTVPRGCHLTLMTAIANRDASRWIAPDLYSIEREMFGHLGFGLGLHSCIGARLIRLCASIATSALLKAFASINLIQDGPYIGEAIKFVDGLTVAMSIN